MSLAPDSLWFRAIFAAALASATSLRLWLALRQLRHVRGHRESVPPAFAKVIDAQAHRKAADYTVARQRLGMGHTLYGAAVLLAWTLGGGLRWLAGANASLLGDGLGAQLALLGEFALLASLLDLPWEIAQTFGLELRFGFNRSTPALFAADQIKGLLLGAVLMAPLALLLLWLMRASALWWLWGWLAFAAFSLVMMVVFPTWIAPLFNRFEPLPEGEVKQRAQQLMQRCGFALQGLYVMDGSRRSAHANAYFTGLGRARRVVLFDTLLRQLAPQQIEAVLAHEVGHYKRHHIQQRLLLSLGLSLLGFALLGWLAGRDWFYAGLGFDHAGQARQAAALVLFSLILPLAGVFVGPFSAGWSRRHEFEADAYAASHSDAGALADALLRMYRDNASTLTPDPWFVRFYYSHPPALQRLARLRPAGGAVT